jgi:hypothetical protein
MYVLSTIAILSNRRLFSSSSKVALMWLHAIRCLLHEFCCNGIQGVTWSYMALDDHLVSVTAIFFAIM